MSSSALFFASVTAAVILVASEFGDTIRFHN